MAQRFFAAEAGQYAAELVDRPALSP